MLEQEHRPRGVSERNCSRWLEIASKVRKLPLWISLLVTGEAAISRSSSRIVRNRCDPNVRPRIRQMNPLHSRLP